MSIRVFSRKLHVDPNMILTFWMCVYRKQFIQLLPLSRNYTCYFNPFCSSLVMYIYHNFDIAYLFRFCLCVSSHVWKQHISLYFWSKNHVLSIIITNSIHSTLLFLLIFVLLCLFSYIFLFCFILLYFTCRPVWWRRYWIKTRKSDIKQCSTNGKNMTSSNEV